MSWRNSFNCTNLNIIVSTDKPCPLKQQMHLSRQGPVHANRGLLDAINEVKAWIHNFVAGSSPGLEALPGKVSLLDQMISVQDVFDLNLRKNRSEYWASEYSGDLKSDTFEIQKHLKYRLFEGQISNGPVFKWFGLSYGYSPNYLKTRPFKIQKFLSGFHKVFKNGSHLSRFQMVGLQNFRSHSKSRPFVTQPLLDHLKSRRGRISDPHCNGNI